MSRILLADDQRDVLEALRILLKGEGYQTEAVTSLAAVFHALEKKDYALLMMDLNYTRDTTSGQEGLAAIPKIQEIDDTLPIVVMTAWATIDLAVDAMKRGARDFVTKPWDNERLLTIVRTQIELATSLRRSRKLEAENQLLRGSMPNLIAKSSAMRPVMEMISRVGPSDANVLITGENGTGKGGHDSENVARGCDGKFAAGVRHFACGGRIRSADRVQQRGESFARPLQRAAPRDLAAHGVGGIAHKYFASFYFRKLAREPARRSRRRRCRVATGATRPANGGEFSPVRSGDTPQPFAPGARVHDSVVDFDPGRHSDLSC